MSIQTELQNELSPADVMTMQHQETVTLIKERAPELIKQYEPEQLAELAKQIEAFEPLPLVAQLPPETPYPTEALTGMDSAVRQVSEQLKIPAALVGQCALGLANGVIQGLVDIQNPVKPKPEPCSLFLLTGAASGEGKSITSNILASNLNQSILNKDLQYQQQRSDYDIALKVYQAEEQKILKMNKKDDKPIDQSDRERLLKELKRPTPPMNPRLNVDDITIEGLGKQFRDGCTRLSLSTDEGASTFFGHMLNNDRHLAVMGRLNQLWDGGQWDCDRALQEHNFSLTGRRLSMNISIQPSLLQNLMSNILAVDQGFMARFLIAMPDTRVHERQIVNIDWQQITGVREYWQALTRLYETKPVTCNDRPLVLKPRILQLSQKARQQHQRFGNNCFKLCRSIYEPIRATVLKAETNLIRIAATLAVWNNPGTIEITFDDVEAAEYLMDYYLQEGLRIADFAKESGSSNTQSQADRLLNYLKQNYCYLVHSVYLTQYAPEARTRKAKTIEKLMTEIVEHGQAIRLKEQTIVDGKPRKNAWLITG